MRVLRAREGPDNFDEVAWLQADARWFQIIGGHEMKDIYLDWTTRTTRTLGFFSLHLTCRNIGCDTVFAAAELSCS